jgi:hypothetical protein
MATTVKCIEFTNATGTHTATILKNKGIYFQVRDLAGEEYAVPKKQVTRQWEEEELTEEEELMEEVRANMAAHAPTLAQALAQVQATDAAKSAPKAKKEPAAPKEIDPNLITLKQLCFDLNVVPRIARRKLRKALGNIGTGSRWEWQKGSEELVKVQLALTTAPAADDAAE